MRKSFSSRRQGGKAISVVAAGLAVVTVLVGYKVWQGMQPAEASGPVVTVAQTAGTSDEVDIVWPVEVSELLTVTAQNNGTLLWVQAQGAATEIVTIDLTPLTDKGHEVKPQELRSQTIKAAQVELLAEMNRFDASGARSTLSALQAVQPGPGPVVVVGSGLDTIDPLRFEALGFDASIDEVVADLKSANEMPKGLAGRDVWLVFTPTSGLQDPLREPHKDYRNQLYSEIITAAGGNVARVLETGGAPGGTGGTAPTVPVPPAPGTYTPEPEQVPIVDPEDPTVPPAVVQRCVLPAAVLFYSDEAILLDEEAAQAMIKTCLGEEPINKVELIGHTAKTRETTAADNPRAMELSQERADAIARIVVDDFHVDPDKVTTYGVGATQPLTEPSSDPANRAVEVIVTYTPAA